METTTHRPNCREQRLVSCVDCRYCRVHNGAQVRCSYPRARKAEVVDLTSLSGWTWASAAEVCDKYEAANTQEDRTRAGDYQS